MRSHLDRSSLDQNRSPVSAASDISSNHAQSSHGLPHAAMTSQTYAVRLPLLLRMDMGTFFASFRANTLNRPQMPRFSGRKEPIPM